MFFVHNIDGQFTIFWAVLFILCIVHMFCEVHMPYNIYYILLFYTDLISFDKNRIKSCRNKCMRSNGDTIRA